MVAAGRLRVLNPVGESRAAPREASLAPRLDTLEGRVIGILDDGWPDPVLKLLEALLKERWPGARSRYWVKPVLEAPSPAHLLDEIASQSDAVIVGLCA